MVYPYHCTRFYVNCIFSRARAERESKLKAMQMRAKKGLLSEEEKVLLASEEAAAAEAKKDCIIM